MLRPVVSDWSGGVGLVCGMKRGIFRRVRAASMTGKMTNEELFASQVDRSPNYSTSSRSFGLTMGRHHPDDLTPSTNIITRPLKVAGVRARASAYSGESYQALATSIEGNSTIER
jgi:hypothetical protein